METDDGSEKKKKPFYRNVEDTIEDVGITQRQLGYWRKQGLFNPELGPKAKFFTQDDTEQLRFLKRMIEDLGLPVTTVRRLIDSLDPDIRNIGLGHIYRFIDIESASLVSPSTAIEQLVAHAIALNSAYELEKWFKALAVELFRKMRVDSKSPRVYEARKQELVNQVGRADLLARIVVTEDGHRFWPRTEHDPELTMEQADQLVAEREKLVKPIRAIEDQYSAYPF